MKRRWMLVFVAAAALAAPAFASPEDEAPRVEFPLGPYFRPGRPLDVRVAGGADRVRAPGSPWALPQGTRGDEFLLQLTEATSGTLALTVERGGRAYDVSLPIERIPAAVVVVGRRQGATRIGDGVLEIAPPGDPPEVPDAWLIADSLGGFDGGLHGLPVDDPIAASPEVRSLCLPALRRPMPEAFPATAEIAALAPRLPADVATVLEILAALQILLVVLMRYRNDPPWTRAAWFAVPSVIAALFVLTGGRLPGALRAAAVEIDASRCRTTFVRVDALRAGSARFVLPPGAGNAWVVRFAPDDPTVADVSAGREVEMTLRAGESRIFCYRMPGRSRDAAASRRTLPPAARAWVVAMGVEPRGDMALGLGPETLPEARGTRVLGAASVPGDGPSPAK